MNNVFIAAFLGYLTDFIGIGIGALCAFLLFRLKKRHLKSGENSIKKNVVFSFIFEFSSGLMMAVVTFRLIPDALLKSGMPMTLTGICFGLLFAHFIQKLLDIKNPYFKTSVIMLINLWLHNIPEGFVLGNSVCSNITAALIFFSAVIIHNIPQGFLITLPAAGEKIKKRTLFYMTFFCGLPTAAGAAAGAALGEAIPLFTGFMLSFAAGSMLYVLVFELSYEAHRLYGRRIIDAAYIAGLILGILIA